MRAARNELLLLALLAAAPVAAHAPALVEGRLLAPGDGAALHLPLRVEAWRAWSRGELPTWNPGSFSGTPLLAAYRPGVLHPLMPALALLPPLLAYDVLVLASLALTGPLVFLLGRRLGAGPLGAGLAALGFVLGPYLVGRLGDAATLVAVPALLLALLGLESHLTRPRGATLVLLAVATALLALAGSREAATAASLLAGARLGLALVARPRPPGAIAGALAAVGTGLLLAAPQLVPTLVAWRDAGPGAAGAADPPAAIGGVAGLVVRTLSHSPLALFALAAVPLLPPRRAPRVFSAAAVAAGLGLAAHGALEAPGGVALAFDLAMALLGGWSFSVQWGTRGEARGRRLRLLATVVALAGSAALSIATTVTGPLPGTLAPALGLLALGLILYFVLAESRSLVVARVFLLPLVASFLLQPWGRQVWASAPTRTQLETPTPTRQALERAMGPRRDERTLTIVEAWPHALAEDLAWANNASLLGRRNLNGYDPLVPASRRRVLDGMRVDGTLPRALLETDPGRLELLGARWLQVPTAALVARADEGGFGDALDVVLADPRRAHLFVVPITRASEVRLVSFLAGSTAVAQDTIVAECVARLASGREVWLPIRAGVDTAEWAWEREDVRRVIRHRKAQVHSSFPVREGFTGHQYRTALRLPGRFAVVSLRLRAWPGAPPLFVLRAGLVDEPSGRATGVGLASAYTSDEDRLEAVAATPRVTLFEVRRGVGLAAVVGRLRRAPDEERLLDLLRSPTRLGIDSAREALATEEDAAGVVLPAGSRPGPAVLARASGGRLVVRAAGPGLLVVSEGFDRGWSAVVDGRAARVLRVNGDRMGVVLGEGNHRVVMTHRAVGLREGALLAALGAVGLALAARRAARV
jgi:hypothetical protein